MSDSKELLNKLGINHKYMIMDELPSGFRSYKNVSKIYVRDLMFDELYSLNLYLNKSYSLEQLINSFSDAIKITDKDNNQFDLTNLELVDFHYLMIVSSILSDNEASWRITRDCDSCGKEIVAKFHFDSISYSLDEELEFPMKLSGTDKLINTVLVKDYILLSEGFTESLLIKSGLKMGLEVFKELLSFAIVLDYKNDNDIIENIKLINSNPFLVRIIKDISFSSQVKINPFEHTCQSCNTLNYFRYDFSVLRGYL